VLKGSIVQEKTEAVSVPVVEGSSRWLLRYSVLDKGDAGQGHVMVGASVGGWCG